MTTTLPYIPPGRALEYVPSSNRFMQQAREFARNHSLDDTMPTASVIVSDGVVIGIAANGSDYHRKKICERVARDIPTGEGYELCEGCHPKNHSEVRAIAHARQQGHSTRGATLYLWGHWWCCEPCWTEMIAAEIARVFVLEDANVLFNKQHPNNVVGHQFEA